jgi:hypothetical protein
MTLELRDLIKETDRAVAKAQAAMAMVVGTANPEPKAAETGETAAAVPSDEKALSLDVCFCLRHRRTTGMPECGMQAERFSG